MSKNLKRFQTSSTGITKIEKVLTPVKILERYSPNIIEFRTIREFQEYLTDHKEEMDAMTTQKLNKTYRVKDDNKQYTITKKLGEISLKAIKNELVSDGPSGDEDANGLQHEDLQSIEERIDSLELKIDAIIKVLEVNGLLSPIGA